MRTYLSGSDTLLRHLAADTRHTPSLGSLSSISMSESSSSSTQVPSKQVNRLASKSGSMGEASDVHMHESQSPRSSAAAAAGITGLGKAMAKAGLPQQLAAGSRASELRSKLRRVSTGEQLAGPDGVARVRQPAVPTCCI